MSKQLGNSPDLLLLIEQYGADATRFGMMISAPAGNDILFDETALEQGRNFNNKMWNALKLIKMWEGRQAPKTTDIDNNFAVDWFEQRLLQVRTEVNILIQQFRLSEALKTIYSLIWDDFCSWYLEWVKPGFEQPIDSAVYQKTISYFTELLQLLHPFMPFITEEIYHLLLNRTTDLCVLQYGEVAAADAAVLHKGDLLKNAITGIRDVRNKQQIKPKESISLFIQSEVAEIYPSIESILSKQINAEKIAYTKEAIADTVSTVIGKDKFYIGTSQPIDTSHQQQGWLKELEHLEGFLASVMKKLSNEKFVQNAKTEVLDMEKKKLSDAETKIKIIKDSLKMFE